MYSHLWRRFELREEDYRLKSDHDNSESSQKSQEAEEQVDLEIDINQKWITGGQVSNERIVWCPPRVLILLELSFLIRLWFDLDLDARFDLQFLNLKEFLPSLTSYLNK